MNLDTVSRGRENNLDLIRFIAAVMVIFCHAFPISLGEGVPDPLSKLTDDQISFGSLAVGIFFVYGGFLICKSMCRVKTAKAYFKARIARIFPPLIVVTLVLTFIAGPVLTSLGTGEYFTNSGTYRYLTNGILVLNHNLPGVFENNIYGQAVNGPLWTLPIEFICYILCFVAYKCKLVDRKNMWIGIILVAAGCAGAWFMSSKIAMLASMIRPMGLFFTGMVYYVYRERIPMKGSLCALSLLGMIASLAAGIFPVMVFLFFPYFFMYIGFALKWKFPGFAKHGEISYGIYLCAWPVQQVLAQYLAGADGKMSPYVNFVLTVPAAIVAGYLLYILVEKPVAGWMKKQSLVKKM